MCIEARTVVRRFGNLAENLPFLGHTFTYFYIVSPTTGVETQINSKFRRETLSPVSDDATETVYPAFQLARRELTQIISARKSSEVVKKR